VAILPAKLQIFVKDFLRVHCIYLNRGNILLTINSYDKIIGIRQGDDVSRLESDMDNQPLKTEEDQEDTVLAGTDPRGGLWFVAAVATLIMGCFYHEVFMLAALCVVMTLVEFFGSSRRQSS
jgi:hypothetical protein